MGHMKKQQKFDFEKIHWKHRFSYGGILRNSRKGRGARPLSGKDPLHLVIKVNKECVRGGLRTYRRYFLIQKVIDRYSRKFFVKIEQVSIQNDHIHFLLRSRRRTQYQNFFRVLSGQIAQQFQKQGLLNISLVSKDQRSVTDNPKKAGRVAVTDTPGFSAQANPASFIADVSSKGEPANGSESNKLVCLWKHRPFTRVVRGWKAYRIARDYVQLNEQEVLGNIAYKRTLLRGLSAGQWEVLWA